MDTIFNDVLDFYCEDYPLNKGWIQVYLKVDEQETCTNIRSLLIPQKNKINLSAQWEAANFDWPEVYYFSEGLSRRKAFPLIIERNYHGYNQNYQDINQKFLLFHNLIKENDYYKKILLNYETEEVIKHKLNDITIKWAYLNEYLLENKLKLLIYFSKRINMVRNEAFRESNLSFEKNKLYWREITGIDPLNNESTFSIIDAKKIILPRKKFNRRSENKKFIIDVDKIGEPIFLEAKPENIENNTLKLVFFKKNVLKKYSESQYFSVGPMSVNSEQWTFQINNNHPSYVSCFFYHLVEQLPQIEQKHWKLYNIQRPDNYDLSNSEIDVITKGIPSEPNARDHRFKYIFERFYNDFYKKNNFSIFKWLNDNDKYCFNELTTITNSSQSDFDRNIGYLSKILIESIDNAQINKILKDKKCDGDKSITLLEKFLLKTLHTNAKEVRRHIKFLRNLNHIRQGNAHRKGAKGGEYERGIKYFKNNDEPFNQIFNSILECANSFILFLHQKLC